jgi:hypothetical protein
MKLVFHRGRLCMATLETRSLPRHDYNKSSLLVWEMFLPVMDVPSNSSACCVNEKSGGGDISPLLQVKKANIYTFTKATS